jgi:hypothetical protein
MTKKDMKAALGASLKAEEEAIKTRFEKAESVLGTPKTTEVRHVPTVERSDRVIRDSFTIPREEYLLIKHLQHRCLQSAVTATKSEILRAGLQALGVMPDKDLLKVVTSLVKVKTGRPIED